MFARMFIKQTSAPVRTRIINAIDNAVLSENSFFVTGTSTSTKKVEVPVPTTETKAPKI